MSSLFLIHFLFCFVLMKKNLEISVGVLQTLTLSIGHQC